MEPDCFTQVHGEYEIHDGPGRQAQSFDLEKHAHRGEVPSAAAVIAAAGDRQVNGGGDLVSLEEASFHLRILILLVAWTL